MVLTFAFHAHDPAAHHEAETIEHELQTEDGYSMRSVLPQVVVVVAQRDEGDKGEQEKQTRDTHENLQASSPPEKYPHEDANHRYEGEGSQEPRDWTEVCA